MQEAWGQSFRFRKDLGLPNQVCLFRHSQYTSNAAHDNAVRSQLADEVFCLDAIGAYASLAINRGRATGLAAAGNNRTWMSKWCRKEDSNASDQTGCTRPSRGINSVE